MADLPGEVEREEILAFLLAKDAQQPRDEPEIAANIHTQLQHMGLSTWSISVHRRLRDAVGRLQPSTVLEIGASIGHRTAWLLDQFERADARPSSLTLVEQGGKFGVILQRLLQRYEAMPWANVVVGEPNQLAAEHQAWQLLQLRTPSCRRRHLNLVMMSSSLTVHHRKGQDWLPVIFRC